MQIRNDIWIIKPTLTGANIRCFDIMQWIWLN